MELIPVDQMLVPIPMKLMHVEFFAAMGTRPSQSVANAFGK